MDQVQQGFEKNALDLVQCHATHPSVVRSGVGPKGGLGLARVRGIGETSGRNANAHSTSVAVRKDEIMTALFGELMVIALIG